MRHYEKCFRFDSSESPEDRAYRVALYRVRALRHFYRKVVTALILIPFFFVVNAMTQTHYWWAWWPTLGFGIAILLRALALFGPWNAFDFQGEQSKVEAYLAKKGPRS